MMLSAFPILTLCLFPIKSQANPTDDLMQKCIKSPKHLIEEGNSYYACDSVSRVDDKSLAMDTADNRARFRFAQAFLQGKNSGMVLKGVQVIDHWKKSNSSKSPLWALAKYKPSPSEKKKLDDFIKNANNSGLTPKQTQALNQNVAGAISQAKGALNSSNNATTPTPTPNTAMGSLAQTKGNNPTNPSSQTPGNSGTPTTSPNASPSATPQTPTTQDVQKPITTPPAPEKPQPKKSKPGFFAKIWNGIKKVGHYLATSRITTGLLLAGAAALMVTGFGAAPGVIIAAAVLGGGIGLAAGPLSQGGSSKSLPPPAPVASSPNSGNNGAPTTPQPTPKDTFGEKSPANNISANKAKTMGDAQAIANALNQNKENDAVTPGAPSAAVTANNKGQAKNSTPAPLAQKTSSHKNLSKPHVKAPVKQKKPAPQQTSYVKDALKGASIGATAGAAIGGAAGTFFGGFGAGPGAAIGAVTGAAIGATVAAWRDYSKNKESSQQKSSPPNPKSDKKNWEKQKPALPATPPKTTLGSAAS